MTKIASIYELSKPGFSDGLPVGSIIWWFGLESTIPAGWLICNGQSCSQYSKLCSILGTNTVPDLLNKFIKASSTAGIHENAALPDISGSFTPQLDLPIFTGSLGESLKINNGKLIHTDQDEDDGSEKGAFVSTSEMYGLNLIYDTSLIIDPGHHVYEKITSDNVELFMNAVDKEGVQQKFYISTDTTMDGTQQLVTSNSVNKYIVYHNSTSITDDESNSGIRGVKFIKLTDNTKKRYLGKTYPVANATSDKTFTRREIVENDVTAGRYIVYPYGTLTLDWADANPILKPESFELNQSGIYGNIADPGAGNHSRSGTIIFKASRSNSIYKGNCSTVTPENISAIPIIKAFQSDTGSSNSTLDCVSYVIETGHNQDNTAFYRKYSDGYIEQWGSQSDYNTTGFVDISLPKTFSNDMYVISVAHWDKENGAPWQAYEIWEKTVGSFKLRAVGSPTSADKANVMWKACGY